jgi:hypothetical protein
MQGLRTLLRSPFARNPGLIARRVATRLWLLRENAPVPTAPVSAAVYPPHWRTALREWLRQVRLCPEPLPFGRVFGQDFDEALLLRLCREGPQLGEPGLLADIKLIWDYSRGHALFTNAAAAPGRLDDSVAFLRRWLDANADTNGRNWTCAMEVAIRAANWIFADALTGGELGRRFGEREWAAWLWRHGWLTWRRLEAKVRSSSNHYLADLLGLIVVGSVFPDDSRARAWLRFGQKEFPRALLAQTRDDGGLDEASLRYHAFVTEMALLARLAGGAVWPAAAEARLRAMCRIVAEFRDASGDVLAFGDDDTGRVLAMDFASTMGRADALLRLAAVVLGQEFKSTDGALCADSGWWVRRAGDFMMAVEFGGVGMRGKGSHAHNDDLSFALEWRGRPVIVDPGTFSYTGDPVARNQFRSTFAHSTLIVDDDEQRGLSAGLFAMPGRDEAWPSQPLGDQGRAFTRSAGNGVTHRREVTVGCDEVIVRDVIEGFGSQRLNWHFLLHPSVTAQKSAHGFHLSVPNAGTLACESGAGELGFGLFPKPYSPGYGLQVPSVVCSAEGEFSLPAVVEWKFRPVV